MRASALPIVSKCRGAWKLTTGYGSQPARVGRAFHEAARMKVREQEFDLESLRTRYGLSDEEMSGIRFGLHNLVINIPEGAFVMADEEQLTALDGKLTGTPDLTIMKNRVLTVNDWKSGWAEAEDPETNNQLLGYAILVLENYWKDHEFDTVDLMIVQPRLNIVKSKRFTVEQIRKRIPDILAIIEEAEQEDAELTTGPWCSSCYSCMRCPAFAGEVVDFTALATRAEEGLAVEAVLTKALPLAKACGSVSRKIESLAKAWVDQNGELELGGGQKYVKVAGTKKELDPKKAFDVLASKFGPDVWDAFRVAVTNVKKVAAGIQRGLSGKVMKELEDVGAVEEVPRVTYRIIKGGNK